MAENQQALEGYYLTLFPTKEKKRPTSPDFSGGIAKSKDDDLGDVIFYHNDGNLSGYFYSKPGPTGTSCNKVKFEITELNQSVELPAIKGYLKIADGPKHLVKLYTRTYKTKTGEDGIYYKGKIGPGIVDQ